MNAEQQAKHDEVKSEFEGKANDAYLKYIDQLRRDECLGAAHKIKSGKFTKAELEAHINAYQWLGMHRAYSQAVTAIAQLCAKPDSAEQVPYGWKLVPLEPTDDMQMAIDHIYNGFDYKERIEIVKAIIDASPVYSAEVKALTDIKEAFEHAFSDEAAVALENARLKEVISQIEKFTDGCTNKSWDGYQNGLGEDVGTEFQRLLNAIKVKP